MNFHELISIRRAFTQELAAGAENKTSALPFIRHTLSSRAQVADNEAFQVIAIGGSFYQKAIMKKVDGNIRILSQSQGEQPQFLKKETLMTFLGEHIDPDIKVLAVNFAYPLSPISRDGVLDGKLQSGSKENTFVGLVDHVVGQSIEKYFFTKYKRKIVVATANDTICLLLSGLVHHSFDELASGVVGTGLNFAIFLDKTTVVNLESANFNKFELSQPAQDIDRNSVAPGDALYEKEVSGAYLYKHYNHLVKQKHIKTPPIAISKKLDLIAKNADHPASDIARHIIDRSASFVAAQIAGILEYQKRDLVFIMQGSLYWKGYRYKETVERLVSDLSTYQATYEQVLHSDLFGAAKLVG